MPNPWEMTYATDPGKQPWEQAWPVAKKLSIEEEASQAAGIPIKGVKPPQIKMEQTPGATGLNVINEAVIRPARSIQKGYYEGAAGGAHLLSNMAKGAGALTGTTPGGAFESAEKYYQDEAQKLEGQGASGLAKPLYEGLGRTPADLAKYTVATTALGGPAGMAAVDAISEADKGIGHAALAGAKGAALGSLGHVMAPARTATRMAGMGTAMGAETAIAGGSPTDIAAATLTGAGMAAPGANGTSFKNARLGEQRANIELENLRREHAQQAEAEAATKVAQAEAMADPVKAMGTRPVPPSRPGPGVSPGQIATRAYDLAATDIEGVPFAMASADGKAKVDGLMRDKSLAAKYINQAKADLSKTAAPRVDAPVEIPIEAAQRSAARIAPGLAMGTRPVLKTEQPVEIPGKSRKEDLQGRFGDKTKAAQDEAYRQGYADVHPEDSTRLPWEESWQARPDTALPATPFKSAAESAAVFEQPRSAKESADVFRKELNQKPRVPETGDPFERRRDTQERMAQQLGGKPWEQLTPDEQQQVNAWIDEGYHGEVIPPQVQAPAPKPTSPAKPMFQQDQRVLGKQEQAARLKEEADAFQQGYRDVHPDDMTRLPWEESWQARPDTAKPATPLKSAEESAKVFTVEDLVPTPRPSSPSSPELPRKEVIQPSTPAGAEQAAPAQRTVADPREMRIPIEDLNVDPQRFQYKMDAYLKGGVTDEHKGVKKFDRDQAGSIAVWRDPSDGKTYVVNGHHRYEMASRLGEDSMAVRYIDAANPAEARLKGAIVNIGDGKGTAIDAAKVFRDSGLTPDDLEAHGITLKGKIAADGLALSKLTGVLFDDVVRGGLTHRQGAIIGKGNLSESGQLAIAQFLAKRPNMREGALEEAVRRAGKAATKNVEQETLFGTNAYEESLFDEENHLVADIKARLGQEKRLFGAVGNQSAASRLAGAGNKIEAERNAQIAGEAGEALGAFDALQDKSGPIADAIAQAAREVADGKPRKSAADRLYDVVRAEVSKALRREEGGLFAESGGGVADGPAEVPGQPRVSQRRLDSQGGFLTIPGKQPPAPLDAADAAAQAWDAKREAARKGPLKTIRDRINQFRKDFSTGLTPILDAFDASQKAGAKIPWKDNWNNAAARSVKAREEAERFVRDQGLQDVLRAPDNYEMFNNFLIAQEVRREASAENRATGVDLNEANAIYNKYANRPVNESGLTYGTLSQKFSNYANDLLTYSTNAWLVSASLAAQLRKQYGAFVPLSRVHAALEAGGAHIGSKSIASLSKQSVYQKRVGSDAAIEYPIETMLERTRAAFMQGEKNKAAALLASFEKKPGMSQFMREVPAHELAKVGMPKYSFSYLRDGKKVVVETTQEWEAALKGLDKETLGTLAKILAAPVRVMKFGTTGINLAFAAVNPFRDWGTILINSKEWKDTALNPSVFWDSTKAALLHDANWSRIEKEGAGFTSLDLFRDTMQKTAEHMRATRSGKDFAKFAFKHPITTAAGLTRALEDIAQRTEQLDRARLAMGTERANLRRGMDPENALAAGVYAANNELPAYHMSGNAIAGLKGAVLYLNARIQGIRSFASAMQDRPASTLSKVVVGLYTPVALLTIANMSTPLGRQVSNDMEEWEKEGNLHWVSPWAKKNERTGRWEGVIKFPLSPDLGTLSTPLRRLIEQQMGGKKVDALKDVARPLAGTVLPFDPTPRGAIVGLAPHVVKAPFEYLANYDTFRDKPTVSQPMQDLPVEEQYRPNTSGTVRKVAGVLNASPVKVEQFVKNVVGGVTPQLLNTADWVASKAGLIKGDQVGGETLPTAVAKRFTSAAGGAQENSYYSLRREAQEKMSRYYIGLLKSTPGFDRFDQKEQQRAIKDAAGRARSFIQQMEGRGAIRDADPVVKVKTMQRFLQEMPQ